MFQSSTQRKLLNNHRLQQQNNKPLNKIETDQVTNNSPTIITIPHFMEFSQRLNLSSSIDENEIISIDGNNDTHQYLSFSKRETPVLRTKMPIVNQNGNLKMNFSQKVNNLVMKQPVSSLDYFRKERPKNHVQENDNHNKQSTTTERFNHFLKKQFFISQDKK